MKKIVLSLITVLIAIVFIPTVQAKEAVPVYMFTKDGCSACVTALEYFEGLEKDNPGLFDLVVLEVFDSEWNWASEDLKNLLTATYERFDEDSSKAATPTIVIGDYHVVGLPQDTNQIYEEIVKVRDSDSKVDEIKKIADDLKIDIESNRKYVDANESNGNTTTKEETESGKYDTIIIIGIFVVLIGGFAGLVIVSKK